MTVTDITELCTEQFTTLPYKTHQSALFKRPMVFCSMLEAICLSSKIFAIDGL